MISRCMHNSRELMLIDNTASNLAAGGSAHLTPDDRIGALKLVGLYATDTFQSFSLTMAAERVEPGYLFAVLVLSDGIDSCRAFGASGVAWIHDQ